MNEHIIKETRNENERTKETGQRGRKEEWNKEKGKWEMKEGLIKGRKRTRGKWKKRRKWEERKEGRGR